jgi:hypothetical protein
MSSGSLLAVRGIVYEHVGLLDGLDRLVTADRGMSRPPPRSIAPLQ